MDETMVQRVARAIMEAGVGCEVTDWREAEWNPHIAQVLAEARAAIEAMREPTYAMKFLSGVQAWPEDSARMWGRMIDAALATPPAEDEKPAPA